MTRVLLTVLVIVCSSIGARAAPAGQPLDQAARQVASPPAGASDVGAQIRKHLAAGAIAPFGRLHSSDRQALESLYAEARPRWLASNGRPSGNVPDALRLLAGSDAHGLRPADYHVDALERLAERLATSEPATAGDLAAFDLAMSASMLRYMRHLHLGRVDPRSLGWRLHVPAERHDMAEQLHTAIAAHRVPALEDALTPPLAQYRQLRAALRSYRALDAGIGHADFATSSRTLHPGDELAPDERQALASRLMALGDLGPDPLTGLIYEEPLVSAVRRFQTRHGLEVDGVIGPATRAALRVPLSWRVRQIELALERLRWLPDLGGSRVIALNIPMFQLWAWESARPDGQPSLGMRAIVGRALRTETPVFVETLREVVFRPYWNVPRSILVGEILPAVARNRAYLTRNQMEIVRGPGDDARVMAATDENIALLGQGVLRLRQRPGPSNSLGLVKFMFPNVEGVYLHGTPARQLFSQSRRDFSHGCVRLEDPAALAEWVLQGQPGWTRETIDEAMSTGGTEYVLVARPVQVVLFYLTAAVSPEDGALHFADDIYRHDAPLDRALAAAER